MLSLLREDLVKLQVSLTREREREQWNRDTKIEVEPHECLSLKLKATNLARESLFQSARQSGLSVLSSFSYGSNTQHES